MEPTNNNKDIILPDTLKKSSSIHDSNSGNNIDWENPDKGTKIQIPTSNRNKFVSINPIDDNINIDMYNIKILLVGNLFVIPIPINLPIAKAVQ